MRRASYYPPTSAVGKQTLYDFTRMIRDTDPYRNYTTNVEYRYWERLKNVKPLVDCSTPKSLLNYQQNLKKIKKSQEQVLALERDNKMLLSRIAHTQTTLDNWNDYKPKPSLIAEDRNRKLVKITKENEALAKNINKARSAYDRKEMIDSYKTSRDRFACRIRRPLKLPPIPQFFRLYQPTL